MSLSWTDPLSMNAVGEHPHPQMSAVDFQNVHLNVNTNPAMRMPEEPATHPDPGSNGNGVLSNGPVNRPIVPSACVACRSKHLKCDGTKPCSRCSTHGYECSYVRSRRGYKGPRKNKQVPGAPQAAAPNANICPINKYDYPPPPNRSNGGSYCSVPNPGSIPTPSHSSETDSSDGNSLALAIPLDSTLDVGPLAPGAHHVPPVNFRDRCMEAFFYYAHPPHPFLLPRQFLLNYVKTRPLPHVEAAMRYVGSYYVPGAPSTLLAQELSDTLARPDIPRDGFAVQARLLFTIGLDGNNEQKRALEILTQAENLALEIGMHQRDFATLHGENMPVLEESWRRTWWELYIVDGMIAGVHQQSSFRLNEIPSGVLLPCEEQDYALGRIPVPHSIEEYDDELFAGEDICFSSFTYRIAAIRNLGKILGLQQVVFSDDPILDKTDAHLVNWGLHLPAQKKFAIDEQRQVDEMLFQAHMITNASCILLHRAHSQMDTTVTKSVTSCAPHRQINGGQQTLNVHAAKIIQAADNISKLITLPVPLVKHTHFFTCVITLASIVHLSCWAGLLPLSQDDNLKQQIRLDAGALKTISDVWPSAHRVGHQVKCVAQEVYLSRKAAAEEGFWNTFTDEEMLQSMIEDDAIISGFQLTSSNG